MQKLEIEINLYLFINLFPEENWKNDNMEKSYLISSNKVKMKDTSEKYKRKQHHQQKQKRFPETPGEHIQIKKQLS